MEILEQVTKYNGKEEKLLSPLFHIILYIFITLGVKLHTRLLNVAIRFIVFLTSATLICRGTDISKCFRESLGIRDNESLLYSSSTTTLDPHIQWI